MKRILCDIGWLLGSRGVNAVFSLVYLARPARVLGLGDFGRFALLIVLAQGVAGLASFCRGDRLGLRRAEARRSRR